MSITNHDIPSSYLRDISPAQTPFLLKIYQSKHFHAFPLFPKRRRIVEIDVNKSLVIF